MGEKYQPTRGICSKIQPNSHRQNLLTQLWIVNWLQRQTSPPASLHTHLFSPWTAHVNEVQSTTVEGGICRIRHLQTTQKQKWMKRIDHYRNQIYKIFQRFYRTGEGRYLRWKCPPPEYRAYLLLGQKCCHQIHTVQTGNNSTYLHKRFLLLRPGIVKNSNIQRHLSLFHHVAVYFAVPSTLPLL